jgi:Co/Zn/Cd efflux system component
MKVKFILSLAANLSALMMLVSYVWMLWCEYERKEIPVAVVMMFVAGMLGLLLSAVGIFLAHFVFRLI